jgi:polysaccharide export outer membrane protein
MRFGSLLFALLSLAPSFAKAEPPGAAQQFDYVLQSYDMIKIVVFQEPDLEREVRLSPESTVVLPLIGTVDLKGKTVRDAQSIIRTLYDRDYLVNPQINVTVVEYAKMTVNVLGSVNTPGPVQIPPDQGLNLLDAIAHAGGFSRLADRKHIKISRTSADGKTNTISVNADDIIQSASNDPWPLQKADVVFVPEKLL